MNVSKTPGQIKTALMEEYISAYLAGNAQMRLYRQSRSGGGTITAEMYQCNAGRCYAKAEGVAIAAGVALGSDPVTFIREAHEEERRRTNGQ